MRFLRPPVLLVAAVLLAAAGCTNDADTVFTDTTVGSVSTESTAGGSTHGVSTTTDAEPSSSTAASTTMPATSASAVDSGNLDSAVQAWVDDFCAAAQELEKTPGPDEIVRDAVEYDQATLAEAASDLNLRYQELAEIVESEVDRTIGEFHGRSARSARDLRLAASEYMAIAAALEVASWSDVESLIDRHHVAEDDALLAVGTFLVTPLELGYTVEFDMAGTGDGCPFVLAYAVPDCAEEPDRCAPL